MWMLSRLHLMRTRSVIITVPATITCALNMETMTVMEERSITANNISHHKNCNDDSGHSSSFGLWYHLRGFFCSYFVLKGTQGHWLTRNPDKLLHVQYLQLSIWSLWVKITIKYFLKVLLSLPEQRIKWEIHSKIVFFLPPCIWWYKIPRALYVQCPAVKVRKIS